MGAQHQFEAEGLISVISLIVANLDDTLPLALWDDAIDLLEKHLLVG